MKTPFQSNSSQQRTAASTTAALFEEGGYTNIPNAYLAPAFLRQVGLEGLGLIMVYTKAYDNAVHHRNASDGWFGITDRLLADWLGNKSVDAVRRIRKNIVNASPRFFGNRIQGITNTRYEYQIRKTTAADRVPGTVWKEFTGSKASNSVDRRRLESGHIETSAVNQALNFVAREFSVIPLKRHAKEPRLSWKPFQTQRPSSAEIEKWLRKWPDSNVGIVTGQISNLVVLDIDGDRNGGLALLEKHGLRLPPTTTVRTGKGCHYWFRYPNVPIHSRARVLADDAVSIDVRGDGGYVVAPPSSHPNGMRYVFESSDEIAEMPSQLVALLANATDINYDKGFDVGNGRPAESFQRWSDTEVAEILKATDLVAVCDAAGVNLIEESADAFKGLCPFHADNNPSFCVTRRKGLWHCFGCGAAGNAIQFLQRMNNLTFPQALTLLQAEGRRPSLSVAA